MKKIGFWAKVVVSVGACFLLFLMIDWNDFAAKIRTANGYWLIPAFLIIHLDRFWMAYKWTLLLKGTGTSASILTTLQAYYVGSFWANFLPASVGADVIRISWVMREMQGGSEIVSSVIIERLLGALALGIVALGSFILAIAYLDFKFDSVFLIIFLLFTASITVNFLIFSQSAHRLVQKLTALLPLRLGRIIEKIRLATLAFKQHPKLLTVFLVLSICEQAFPITAILVLAKAFYIDLPWVWAFIGVPIVLAASRMPISVSGVGVTEGFYVFVFSLAGLQASDSAIIAITDRLLLLLAALPGAFWTITGSKRKITVPSDIQMIDASKGN